MITERFVPQKLIEQACEQAGSDDFGDDDTWRDGLARLCDGFASQACLNALGVEIATQDVVRPLVSRLQIIKWRKENPDVATSPVTRPIFIVGQPRTGTTILFDLLAQDPALRPPLTWEVDSPWPLPTPETYDTDPRIAESQASLEMSEQIVPGLLAFHPMGAKVGQECVRITMGQFCSMTYTVQYRLPTYSRWLLYEADHRPAYRYHRMFLQHLQSGVPGGPCQWLLKSPAHLWRLDDLVAEYPDALIVQTHRDPLNVISSISALAQLLRRLASDESSITECAQQYRDEIVYGLERAMKTREALSQRVVDVQFADFMRDPFTTIRALYAELGRELEPVAEQRMREFLAAHPGDGGGSRYSWADTGLDAAEVRERVRPYQERYGVPDEPLR